MGDDPGLEIADVVEASPMHELEVAQPALVRLLEPFELAVEEIEPFRIADDRRIARLVRGFEVGGGKRAADAVMGDELVHPPEPFEMELR